MFNTENYKTDSINILPQICETCIVDNAANTHIWNSKDAFIPKSFKVITSSDGVSTISGSGNHPSGIGEVPVS